MIREIGMVKPVRGREVDCYFTTGYVRRFNRLFRRFRFAARPPRGSWCITESVALNPLGDCKGRWTTFQCLVCFFVAFSLSAATPYDWRGVLLDESRHFFGKETVKTVLDRMAEVKLNVFHWHLTDDQGWRLEIKRYPELTRRGAVRRLVADWRPQPVWFDACTEGDYGPYFYTADDVREIVAYARARGIRVVPEIEMPGHSLAALASYPDLCCFPEQVRDEQTFLHPPFSTPGRNKRSYCLGSEQTIRFLEGVLDEVCEQFPDEVVHIGGDETPQGNWKECPKCQAKKKALGLKDERALQGWFMNHFIDYLARKGKRAMGWEECLYGNPDPKAVIVQCWHETKSTRLVLERGYEVVLSPPTFCYFDFPQGLVGDKLHYNGATDVTIERVRAFHPAEGLPESLTSQILGAECCNWSECTADAATLMFKMWPRTAVFASRLADRSLIKFYRKE